MRAVVRFVKRLMVTLAVCAASVGLFGAPVVAEQTQIPPEEYAALVALYESAGGFYWLNKWTLPTDDPCGLYGVHCEDGHVVWLGLYENGMFGPIPPELGNLTRLFDLDLETNQLSGPIPPELGNLTSLKWLFLGSNQLSGAIPSELGNLAKLETLQLGGNQLSGTIPPALGNLTSLRELNLAVTLLQGAIPPELGNLTSLWSVKLHANHLMSGPLPHSLMGLSLGVFWFGGTGLCEPTDAAFHAWLSGIADLRGTNVPCPEWRVLLPLIARPG